MKHVCCATLAAKASRALSHRAIHVRAIEMEESDVGGRRGIAAGAVQPQLTRGLARGAGEPAALGIAPGSALPCHLRHGRRSHPHCGAEDRHPCLGAGRHPHPRPRQGGQSRHPGGRTRLDRSRPDRTRQRLGRLDRLGLVVGRARTLTRRQAGVLPLFVDAGRDHDPRQFGDRRHRRSQGQEAGDRRRAARQELADAPGGRAPRRPRSQEPGEARLWRPSPAVGEGAAGRASRRR